jgi:hypothetical protein
LVARLAARYRAGAGVARDGPVDIVLGEHACHEGFRQVLRGAAREVRVCESAYSVNRGTPAHELVREQLGKGVRFRVLYDSAGFDDPARVADLDREVSAGEEARIVEVPLKVVLTDEPAGWVALRHPAYGNFARLRVRDESVLTVLSEMFEMLWEQAMPLPSTLSSAGRVQASGEGADDADLAWLLAAGLSERGIADYLGCHERTARRRVRAMMARLDAQTAFQTGYQLARRGQLAAVDGVRRPRDANALAGE